MHSSTRTFGHAVEHDPWIALKASDGGDVHDASPAGDGGVPEERVRELAEVEARLQVGRHEPGVVLRRALHRRLDHHLRRVVHLSSPSSSMHAGHALVVIRSPAREVCWQIKGPAATH